MTTFGDRAADAVARTIGRWAFVTTQTIIIAIWMWWNAGGGFDPYPFILLNLALSLQAAYTGPVLLISANRADDIRSRTLAHVEALAESNGEHTEQMQRHAAETHAAILKVQRDHARIMRELGLIEREVAG